MTNPKILLTDFSFYHLVWCLDHKCFGLLLLPGNLPMMVYSLLPKMWNWFKQWIIDKMENIVTEEEDRKEEKQRIRSALKECGYPKWAMDRIKQQITYRPQKPTMKKKDNSSKSRGRVVIPYVEGVSEKIKLICSKHNIHTARRPTNTLKKHLSSPKG